MILHHKKSQTKKINEDNMIKLKEFQSLENDVCHARRCIFLRLFSNCNPFGNVATVTSQLLLPHALLLPNGLQLRLRWTVRDKVRYKQCLHVPYKSELIITQISTQTSINICTNKSKAKA